MGIQDVTMLAGPPLSEDMRQRLQGVVVEMMSDKFWRDMASPIQAGLIALRDESEAFDKVSAAMHRKKALTSLEASEVQLAEAAKNKMFVMEHELVKAALAQIKGEDGASAAVESAASAQDSSKSASANTEATSEQAALVATLQAKQAADKGQAPAKPAPAKPAESTEFVVSSPPYTWSDMDDDGSVGVSIPVPANTQKKDVSVVFKPKRLVVKINGHPLEPVIDAELLYAVQSDSCSWGLEGSGAKRKVALNLEKVSDDEKWASLFNDEQGRMAKELAGNLQGMGLEQWTPDHTK